MLNNKLKVKIPKKFKKQFIARFSVSNAKKIASSSRYPPSYNKRYYYLIKEFCPLCRMYKNNLLTTCTSCPFANFAGLLANLL